MGAPAYHQPAPVQILRHRHSLVIGDVEMRCSTGKIIPRDAYGDALGDGLAADTVRR